jgi:tetratricopeptide (TPR) repeat protein
MKRAVVGFGLVLGLVFLAAPAGAQTGTARGKVTDSKGQPIVDVRVLIEYQGGITRKFEVKTNKKGEWMQVGMQPGLYRFTASREGYQTTFSDFRISLGEPTEVPEFKLATAAEVAKQAGGPAAELKASFEKAVELTNAGKLDEAEAAYKAILETSPDIPEVYQNLGYIAAQKKDFTTAEAQYLKALELRPDSSDVATALARVYQENGQPEKAMALIEKQAGANPADAKAQFNRGIFLLNAGQSAESIKAFEAAIAADPQLADAYYHLGTQLVGQGKIPEAIQELEKFLSMNPTNAQNVATAQGLLKALKK